MRPVADVCQEVCSEVPTDVKRTYYTLIALFLFVVIVFVLIIVTYPQTLFVQLTGFVSSVVISDVLMYLFLTKEIK